MAIQKFDISDFGGLKVTDNCAKYREEQAEGEVKPLVTAVTSENANLMRQSGLVPEGRINDEYSTDFLRERVGKLGRNIVNLEGYIKIAEALMTVAATGRVPNRSYIIGAPNGFSKTTLVNTLIKRLFLQGKKVAPYITCEELAEKWLIATYGIRLARADWERNEQNVGMRCINEVIKQHTEDRYTYWDYLNADMVFTSLHIGSNMAVMDTQLNALSAMLKRRAMSCKPTIVMVDQQLPTYANISLTEVISWQTILAKRDIGVATYDKLAYVKCYFAGTETEEAGES